VHDAVLVCLIERVRYLYRDAEGVGDLESARGS
jgi:hypothetical protein